jgi:L-aspartate oxidase
MSCNTPISDVLIVGSGAAGLMFAAHISKYHNVCLITKDTATESNTRYAQGGIAAVLSIDDSYSKHISDTLKAGDGHGDVEAVNTLVKEAPARIFDLICMGVDFDRLTDNALQVTKEGGHSDKRVIHVGDMTGQAIESALWNGVKKEKLIVFDHETVTDLLVRNNVCYGVESIDRNGRVRHHYAKAVFLATGGAGKMFAKTTNPDIANGDGFVMAESAGAMVKNLEFIQFHPTVLTLEHAPCFLITEAARGEGAKLVNVHGYRFMKDYHTAEELAPRDIVSRAIVSEMQKTSAEHVYLDMTHKDKKFVEKRFPTITATLQKFGLHPARNKIPVAPAAHYFCGGVHTDIDGRTTIDGLYAGGEVACTGVHGANRLASNSLLESVVFAYRAAVNADRRIRYLPQKWYSDIKPLTQKPPREWQNNQNRTDVILALKKELQHVNWKYCGIIRTDQGLRDGMGKIGQISKQFDEIAGFESGHTEAIALRNLIRLSESVYRAAIARRINAGTHFNSDCLSGHNKA